MTKKKLFYIGIGPHGEAVIEIVAQPEPPPIIKVCGV